MMNLIILNDGFGIGHLITTKDEEYGAIIGTIVSEKRVNAVFDTDVNTYIDEAKKVFGNLEEMPQEAQQVIVNMCFNMGSPRLSQFKKFIKAIHDEDWTAASVEMLNSKWAKQVGERANRLSDRIKAIN